MTSNSQGLDPPPDDLAPDVLDKQDEPTPTPPLRKVMEKREVARHATHLRVMVAIGKKVLQGRSEDVSVSGASLRLTEMLPAGARIQVRLLSPLIKLIDHLDVAAVVRYSTMSSGEPPCRVGVQFVDTDADSKRKLMAILQG